MMYSMEARENMIHSNENNKDLDINREDEDVQEYRNRRYTSNGVPGSKRIRSSDGKRDYICGCEKTYLSYPAIYTHVRIKHNGIFPKDSYFNKDDQVVKLQSAPNKSSKNSIQRYNKEVQEEGGHIKEEFVSFLKLMGINFEKQEVVLLLTV